MIRISHQQLKRMLAGRQFQHRFGLTGTEMEMVLVVRYWLIKRGQRHVDQEMMVSGVRPVKAGRANTKIPGSEPDTKAGGVNDFAVVRPAHIDIGGFGAGRRCGLVACPGVDVGSGTAWSGMAVCA